MPAAPPRPTRFAPFPASAQAQTGHLWIAGVDLVRLAEQHGTPLYAFDEAELRARCRAFQQALQRTHGAGGVFYAAKAGLPVALARLVREEGLGLDLSSAGELAIARAADFPMDRAILHGNNKSAAELRQALAWGVGAIVVDSLDELDALAQIARGRRVQILLRLTPEVETGTHPALATAAAATKFGFPLAGGRARTGLRRALAQSNFDLAGFHCHIGSQVERFAPYRAAIAQLLAFAAAMQEECGFAPRRLNMGGGFAIRYGRQRMAGPAAYIAMLSAEVGRGAHRHRLPVPALDIEPGRAIAGPPGIALYRVGVCKQAPNGRSLVAVDGGMADNVRPALYGARHAAVLANRPVEPARHEVAVVGRYCETGDVLIPSIRLPAARPGDLLAVAAAGAYCLAMASNYNGALRPPILFLRAGRARLVRRRETARDLLRCEQV